MFRLFRVWEEYIIRYLREDKKMTDPIGNKPTINIPKGFDLDKASTAKVKTFNEEHPILEKLIPDGLHKTFSALDLKTASMNDKKAIMTNRFYTSAKDYDSKTNSTFDNAIHLGQKSRLEIESWDQ